MITSKQCINCAAALDAYTCETREGAMPKAGDFGTCVNCGQVYRYNAELCLMPATQEDLLVFYELLLEAIRPQSKNN